MLSKDISVYEFARVFNDICKAGVKVIKIGRNKKDARINKITTEAIKETFEKEIKFTPINKG